jgi:hypothetical protein
MKEKGIKNRVSKDVCLMEVGEDVESSNLLPVIIVRKQLVTNGVVYDARIEPMVENMKGVGINIPEAKICRPAFLEGAVQHAIEVAREVTKQPTIDLVLFYGVIGSDSNSDDVVISFAIHFSIVNGGKRDSWPGDSHWWFRECMNT